MHLFASNKRPFTYPDELVKLMKTEQNFVHFVFCLRLTTIQYKKQKRSALTYVLKQMEKKFTDSYSIHLTQNKLSVVWVCSKADKTVEIYEIHH